MLVKHANEEMRARLLDSPQRESAVEGPASLALPARLLQVPLVRKSWQQQQMWVWCSLHAGTLLGVLYISAHFIPAVTEVD